MKKEDLTNKRFGNLIVISEDCSKKRIAWKCKCDCGNYTIGTSYLLKSGQKKSCGCLNHKLKHGMSKRNEEKSRILRILGAMKQRCNNPNNDSYIKYGLIGIKVCEEWNNKKNGSINFIKWALENGYSDDKTIDRIDNNKGYYPENCRWTDKETQTLNRNLKIKNKTGCIGVRISKNCKYNAGITFNKKYIHLGTFLNLEDAIKARKEAEIKYFKNYLEGENNGK